MSVTGEYVLAGLNPECMGWTHRSGSVRAVRGDEVGERMEPLCRLLPVRTPGFTSCMRQDMRRREAVASAASRH